MKITNSQSVAEAVRRLAEVRVQKRELEKLESKLKSEVLLAMAEEKSLLTGQFIVTLSIRTRASLDREALIHDLGDLEPYTVYTPYQQLDIKPA
jgi:hypothetical protein